MVPQKNPKAITDLKKEGGGVPARYDHDHRFNCFLTPSLRLGWQDILMRDFTITPSSSNLYLSLKTKCEIFKWLNKLKIKKNSIKKSCHGSDWTSWHEQIKSKIPRNMICFTYTLSYVTCLVSPVLCHLSRACLLSYVS